MTRSIPDKSALAVVLLGALLLIPSAPTQAQVGKWLKDKAKQALKREAGRQVDKAVRNAIRCAVGEVDCYEKASREGRKVVFVDDAGEVIVDDRGEPVTNPADLPAEHRRGASVPQTAAGPGVDARSAETGSDFEAGERTLFHEDYADDRVGDFPRGLEFVKGNWEVVTWKGRRFLRNTGPRGAAFNIHLPETLPERFTVETEVHLPHANQQLFLYTEVPERAGSAYRGQYLQIAGKAGTGVRGRGDGTVESIDDDERLHDRVLPVRFMVDGDYVKAYVGDHRTANAPNAELPRTRTLQLYNSYFADAENPILVGPIRVAAGGRDLYTALSTDGRVAIQDIHFDSGTARIRPESAETLASIAEVLDEHDELNILIEGHTDASGGFDDNMKLSRERAEAVKSWLVERHALAPERLRTMGLGQTRPVADNHSPAGRQENRRVELVRLQ